MKDRFKEFIQGHRNEFEVQAPEKEMLWQMIHSELQTDTRTSKVKWQIISVAASLLLVASVVFLLPPLQTQSQQDPMASEFVKTQDYYKSQIDNYSVLLTSYDPQFLPMFDDFDKQYELLEKDFKLTGDLEVLEEMIEIQRAKLVALKTLLEEIKTKEERHDLDL